MPANILRSLYPKLFSNDVRMARSSSMICQRTSMERALLLLTLPSLLSGESRHQSTVVRVFLEQNFHVTGTRARQYDSDAEIASTSRRNCNAVILSGLRMQSSYDTDCIEYYRLTEYTKISIHDAQIKALLCFDVVHTDRRRIPVRDVIMQPRSRWHGPPAPLCACRVCFGRSPTPF